MEHFRTELNISPAQNKISLNQPLITMGSCFAESIGDKLIRSKFSVLANPFGTVYNPVSIHKLLLHTIHNQACPDHTYLQNQGITLNYDFHSQFADTSKSGLETKIKEAINQAHHFLKNTKHLFITYGTSWVYERVDTEEIVANCHKMPSQQFKKNLLTQKKIIESFDEIYKALKGFNPDLKIILTVSPVRHLKDTLELNSVSKSILRITCHTLTELYSDVGYFPAYEILLDDLRDYRFYSADLIHPTPTAIDYIWRKFSDSYFDTPAQQFLEEWHEISKALAHKPFQPSFKSHQQFLIKTLLKLEKLKSIVSVEEEINYVQTQLIKS